MSIWTSKCLCQAIPNWEGQIFVSKLDLDAASLPWWKWKYRLNFSILLSNFKMWWISNYLSLMVNVLRMFCCTVSLKSVEVYKSLWCSVKTSNTAGPFCANLFLIVSSQKKGVSTKGNCNTCHISKGQFHF